MQPSRLPNKKNIVFVGPDKEVIVFDLSKPRKYKICDLNRKKLLDWILEITSKETIYTHKQSGLAKSN
jgi:hypothetical protein